MFDAPVDQGPPAIEVRGELRCPRSDEVAAALARMLGPASPDAPADVAELSERDGAFVITLRRASGEPLGEKRLPATLGCQGRAQAAAVSIAALAAQLGGAGELPLPGPVPEAPAPPEAPRLVAPAPTVVEAVEKASRQPEARAPLAFELGAGVLASVSGSDLAPAGRLEVALLGRDRSWAVVVAGQAAGAHWIAVSPGQASWARLGGEVAVRAESPLGRRGRLQPGVGLALTALTVEGHGFSRTASDTLFDLGGVARLRFALAVGRLRPWLDVAGVYWPRSHRLTVLGGPTAEVPSLDFWLGLGASFGGSR
jgi:hypothetical protein